MQTAPNGARPRVKPRRLRQVRQFTLSKDVDDRIDRLSIEQRISRSDVIEKAIRLDYAAVFRLFVANASLAEVVIATGIEPRLVRSLWDEFRAGYEPVESSQALAVAKAQERAARERRLATESRTHARLVEADVRERVTARRAFVDLEAVRTRKHLGELAETTKILTRARTRQAGQPG
jgi:Ribbon-helix-helix protein, copG family